MSNVKWRLSAIRASQAELPLIVEAARFGDSVAYEEIVSRCYKPVRRYCVAMGNGFDADDLTQETFLRALKSSTVTSEILNLEAFMIHIAKFVCADYIRQVSKTRALNSRLKIWEQSEATNDLDSEHLDIQDTLSYLGEHMREAFVLTQLLGFSYDECSDILNVPVGTIRSRVSRARTLLQSKLTSESFIAGANS